MKSATLNPEKKILFYDFKVPAGLPSPILDNVEDRIDLNKELIQHPHSHCRGSCPTNRFPLWF